MRSLQAASAAGAAFRPLARRSLLHIPIPPSAIRQPTTPRLSRHYHNPDPRSLVNKPPARPPAPTPRPPRRRTILSPRYLPILLALAAAGVAWDSQWLFPDSSSTSPDDPSSATILGDARRFIRFNVVARDQVSPTSFVLTLKPSHASPSHLSSLWDVFDLWCVEVKQPQIQVAREYTPLPPAEGTEADALRLYVRAVRGGEVSTYLGRLSPAAGNTVELRGPHGEFDLRSRLGRAGERVVFLAGGTGIASALQAAHAVLPLEEGPSMTIFWAVRSRDEIQAVLPSRPAPVPAKPPRNCWNPFSATRSEEPGVQAEALSADAGSPSPIGRELLALREKHPGRLDVRVVVDEEGTAIREPDLASALTSPTSSPTTSSDDCRFHSQTAHLGMVDGAPNAGKKPSFKEDDCACPKHDGATPGKNLFVVSGPEGFVQAYAGAKIWRDGGQLQGPVGGMLGRMQRQNPGLLRDWVVLKL